MNDSSSSSSEDNYIFCAAATLVSEDFQLNRGWHGQIPGSRPNLNRGICTWYRDYLSPNPVYSPSHFRRRFRIPLSLFKRLERELPIVEPCLRLRTDAAGKRGPEPWQKILSALRRLADGCSYSTLDDQSRMCIETIRQCFIGFNRAMKKCYGKEYLKNVPTSEELSKLEHGYSLRNFPGCVGSLDCMHLHWKNCPKAQKGQYHNPKTGKLATVSVEAVADFNLYCWHIFSRRSDTNNDITVLESSPFIMSILTAERPTTLERGYTIDNKRQFWPLYFLTDGIYPDWSIFVKPNHAPKNAKESAMTAAQEGRRKDLERLFGVLQGRLKILRHEFHQWKHESLSDILDTCIILHNMLVKCRLNGQLENERDDNGDFITATQVIEEFCDEQILPAERAPVIGSSSWLETLMGTDDLIRNKAAHHSLRNALENHIWSSIGSNLN